MPRRIEALTRRTLVDRRKKCDRFIFVTPNRDLTFTPFWQLQIIGWSGFYVLVLVAAAPYLKQPGVFRDNSLWVLTMFAASWILPLACRASLRSQRAWFVHEVHAIALALCLGAITSIAVDLLILGLQKMDWGSWLIDFVQSSVVFFVWCNLYFGAKQWQQIAEQREKILAVESQVREARLDALRYQLNPHFLFNALNAVSTLVLEGDSLTASRMLTQISQLLRRALDPQAAAAISLSQEIVFTEQYLEVEQIRLGERLRVQFAVSPDTLDALVPIMLLQPLVENAVRHGVASQVSGGTILIETRRTNSRLHVLVRNSGPRGNQLSERLSLSDNGVGLKNCNERLQVMYGTDYRLNLAWPDNGGCEVSLNMPFRTVAPVGV